MPMPLWHMAYGKKVDQLSFNFLFFVAIKSNEIEQYISLLSVRMNQGDLRKRESNQKDTAIVPQRIEL